MRARAAALLIVCAGAATAQPVPDPQPEQKPAAPAPPITPPQPVGPPVEAEYPVGETGGARVVLDLEVDAQGQVAAAHVVSPPRPRFDESALAAARRLRFDPARRGDESLAVRIQFAFNFAPPPAPSAPADQAVNVSGTVRERGSRRRLSGIEVAMPSAGFVAVTDGQGRFELRGVPPGDAELVVTAPGFQRLATPVTVEPGKRTDTSLLLEPLFANPFEATVEGERDREELSRTTITTSEIQRIPGAQGDALKVIEDLPGVARTSPIGGGLLVIRGSNPGDSLVYLDGEPIPLLYHFGAISSTINPDLLEGIDFIPGNFSAGYGDLVGGLVEVRSRKLRDEPHGYANLNLLEASAMVESSVPGVPGLSFALAGRRSYIDYILRAAVSEGDVRFTVAPRYYDAQLRVDWRPPGSNHALQFLALTSDDKLGLLVARPIDQDPNISGNIDTETGFEQLRLKHSWRSGALAVDSIAMFERLLLRFAVAQQDLDVLSRDLFLRSTVRLEASDALSLSAGIDLANRRALVSASFQQSLAVREGEFNNQGPRIDEPLTTLPPTLVSRFSPGLWAEARIRPLPGLTLTPGVRLDAYVYGVAARDRTTTATLSPRLAVRWEASPVWAFKAGAGLYSQGARNADAVRPFGNPDVLPERAFQLTAGAEMRPLPGLFFSGEAFYKRLSDIIVRSPDTQVIDGQTLPVILDNAGIGRVVGVEVLLRKELTDRLFGWLAYTYSRSQRIDRPGEPWRLFDFDQTHNLTAIASYKLPRGWQIGARFRFITGNPETPVVGSRYLAPVDVYLPIYGLTNSDRVPPFSQLDVRVDKVWTFDAWTLDAYLDVLNAYNRRPVEATLYSYDFGQSQYLRGLPIIPTLGLKGSF
ncbi:MAG TPA: TonB-dependent receptor [Myxococcales bacterium]